MSSRRLYSLPNILTLLFLLTGGYLTLHHVLWLDEAQGFLLARDSSSIVELFANMRYEGHPPLWHLLVFFLTRFTSDPVYMQILHLLLASASVYLFTRYSPFPVLAKILFPFGYFAFFEYAVIARNYQLIMLLTFTFCALWQHRRNAYIALAIVIALLCFTHVLGVILACGLTMLLLLDALCTPSHRAIIVAHPLRFAVAFVIIVLSAAASVLVLMPPPDGGFSPGWNFTISGESLTTTLSALYDGLLPLPPRQTHFWDYHLLDVSSFAVVCGCVIWTLCLLFVCTSWRSLTFFLITSFGLLAFMHVKFFGSVRHHGAFFITFIAALWIFWAAPPALARMQPIWKRRWEISRKVGLASLLAAHVYAAAVAVWFSVQAPFSSGDEAAHILKTALRPDDVIVADSEWVAPSLAIHFPGRKFYFPMTSRWGTFIVWRKDGAWAAGGITSAQKVAEQFQKPVVFITHYPIPNPPPNVQFLGETSRDQVMEIEHFALYRVPPAAATASAPAQTQ